MDTPQPLTSPSRNISRQSLIIGIVVSALVFFLAGSTFGWYLGASLQPRSLSLPTINPTQPNLIATISPTPTLTPSPSPDEGDVYGVLIDLSASPTPSPLSSLSPSSSPSTTLITAASTKCICRCKDGDRILCSQPKIPACANKKLGYFVGPIGEESSCSGWNGKGCGGYTLRAGRGDSTEAFKVGKYAECTDYSGGA